MENERKDLIKELDGLNLNVKSLINLKETPIADFLHQINLIFGQKHQYIYSIENDSVNIEKKFNKLKHRIDDTKDYNIKTKEIMYNN
jgi:hypothetical protein